MGYVDDMTATTKGIIMGYALLSSLAENPVVVSVTAIKAAIWEVFGAFTKDPKDISRSKGCIERAYRGFQDKISADEPTQEMNQFNANLDQAIAGWREELKSQM